LVCQLIPPRNIAIADPRHRNVGFLNYWTVSNLPLFLLATPMLIVLCRSSLWALKIPFLGQQRQSANQSAWSKPTDSLFIQLAVPQALLAIMAFTSYHVQIINRISSGYPVWYWYLASQVRDHFAGTKSAEHGRIWTVAVQSMVLYGLIQAVLFGSFLPPA
jgi:phosphatidylinositol glycan class V